MTQDLRRASSDLEDAAESADGDLRDTLQETARELDEFAEGDAVADHALLDEQLNALRQVRERADGVTRERVESAIETVEAYRETVDQA